MDDALVGPSNLTASSLRATVRQLRQCASELAALGPPAARLRPVYRLARQACGDYEHGASCYAAAATIFNAAPAKINKLFRCGDTAVNNGTDVVEGAIIKGAGLQPPA